MQGEVYYRGESTKELAESGDGREILEEEGLHLAINHNLPKRIITKGYCPDQSLQLVRTHHKVSLPSGKMIHDRYESDPSACSCNIS